jgi:hypothetical protein
MAEENIEETIETPTEPETEVKETVEGEEPKKREYSDLEKQLYARAKKAEAEAKRLKDATTANAPSLDGVQEFITATKDLEPDEVEELKLRAAGLGKSLSEARKDKMFNLTLQALREEKRKSNAPEPSSRQEGEAQKKSIKDMSLSEKETYLRNLTVGGKPVKLLPTWGNPQAPSRT